MEHITMLNIQQKVKVKVIEIDYTRNTIALSIEGVEQGKR
jgi:predicted RNA-binding protein with RPS1 domain